MITREQLDDVEDRQKLLRLAVAGLLVVAIAFILLLLVLAAPSLRDELQHSAPAASEGAAGAERDRTGAP